MFGDEVMAAALIDRVLHHCHLVNIRGNSYRLRDHSARRPTLTAQPAPTTSLRPSRKPKAVATS